jgi:hypothetical protein
MKLGISVSIPVIVSIKGRVGRVQGAATKGGYLRRGGSVKLIDKAWQQCRGQHETRPEAEEFL